MNEKKQWRFDPLDSWFFREARAFDTSGSNELNSLFPPPARTVAGAVRTLIGETQGVDWEKFALAGEYTDLKRWIGADDHLGALKIDGPYPLWNSERLYPVPLHLLVAKKEKEQDKARDVTVNSPRPLAGEGGEGTERLPRDYVFLKLKPGDSIECDLGKVQLPKLEKSLPGAKPLENAWLDRSNLQRVLRSESPQKVYETKELCVYEPRLGIARNNAQRTAADGLLYQTRHIRPCGKLAIGVIVSGIPLDMHPAGGVIRFGGEGRASAVTVNDLEPIRKLTYCFRCKFSVQFS